MTSKAKNKSRNNTGCQAQPQAQTITLNQPNSAEELKVLFNTFLECVGNGSQAGSQIVITKEDGKTTISRRVGETVTKIVTVVKNTVKTVAAKSRSMCRIAWNRTIAFVTAIRNGIAAVTRKTKAYVCLKAVQLSISALILYAKIKSSVIRTKNHIVRKSVQFAAWTVRQWNALKVWSIATWTRVKPHAVQIGRIAAVTAVLYIFATATVLVTCLAVAVLGLSAYDRTCESLVNQTNRKSTSTGKKKRDAFSSPKQKTLLGV